MGCYEPRLLVSHCIHSLPMPVTRILQTCTLSVALFKKANRYLCIRAHTRSRKHTHTHTHTHIHTHTHTHTHTQLHKVEADTDHEDNSRQCMKTSQSHDNLCNFKPPIDQSTLPQETKQTHKKMGIFGRFRKKQTMKKGKSGTEGGRVKFGGGEMAEEGEGLPHSGGITSSLSMPDIACEFM